MEVGLLVIMMILFGKVGTTLRTLDLHSPV